MSSDEAILTDLREFTAAWNELPVADKTAYLQKLSIDDNKSPAGSKQLLDSADDGTSYSQVHKKRHPWLRNFVNKKEFYDLFLINKAGDIVTPTSKNAISPPMY